MGRGLSQQSKIGELFDALLTAMSNPIGVGYAGGVREYREMVHWQNLGLATQERNRLREQLKRLQAQRYIELIKQGKEMVIKLDDRGFEEVLKRRILHKSTTYPDGRFCYISFDIPETWRAARDSLRFLLKRGKFQMIHQSFWYTKRDVGKELTEFVRSLGVERFVQVIEGFALTELVVPKEFGAQKKIRKTNQAIKQIEAERKALREMGCRISLQ